jgi:hypothetical protein
MIVGEYFEDNEGFGDTLRDASDERDESDESGERDESGESDERDESGESGESISKVNKYNRITFLNVNIDDVVVPEDYISQDPHKNIQGMVQDIQEHGLLDPIKILTSKVEGEYILVDGLRRLTAYKSELKKDTIASVIIGDSTKLAKRFGDDFLRFKLGHKRGFSIQDKYDFVDKVTRKGKSIDERDISELEDLLELCKGDYLKMLDLRMDSTSEESQNREKPCSIFKNLLDGKMKSETEIGAAHKKLEARRKKDLKASAESVQAETQVQEDSSQESDGIQGEYSNDSDDGADSKDGDGSTGGDSDIAPTSAEELAQMVDSGEINKHNKQDRKTDNDRLDPDLRKAVLARDRHTCLACGVGAEAPEVFGATFEVHHLRPVYLGGVDRIDELGTFCKTCHALIHALERGKLIFPSGDDIKRLSSDMQDRLLKVNHYGGLALSIKKGKDLPKNLFYMRTEDWLEYKLEPTRSMNGYYGDTEGSDNYEGLNDVNESETSDGLDLDFLNEYDGF